MAASVGRLIGSDWVFSHTRNVQEFFLPVILTPRWQGFHWNSVTAVGLQELGCCPYQVVESLSCLVLQNNQQFTSWGITLLVVGYSMQHVTGASLDSWALKAAGVFCSTTTAGSWFQSLTGRTANDAQPSLWISICDSLWSCCSQLRSRSDQD